MAEQPDSPYVFREPDLSVVLPCYRTAEMAIESARSLSKYLETVNSSWEIIIVDDGGGDFRDGALAGLERVRLLRLPSNRGKGAAVREGLRLARGRVRIFTDADIPYELTLIPVMAEYLSGRGFHVVIGDRTLPDSSYLLDVGLKRRAASSVFSFIVGKLVTGGFFDTQCGIKAFRGDIADIMCQLGRIDRFAFDVELLYLSLTFRLDIKRVPVRLRSNTTSSVRLFRDSMRMVYDVLRIKYHQLRGYYRSTAMERIVSADFARVRESVGAVNSGCDAPPRLTHAS